MKVYLTRIQTRNLNVRYFNFFIQTSYLENEGNLIASNSNTIHFNFSALLKCFIQTHGEDFNSKPLTLYLDEAFQQWWEIEMHCIWIARN